MTELIKKIQDNKAIILQSELGAILHDLGKLSNEFLKYRQEWRKAPKGWDNDPHTKLIIPEWLKNLKWDVKVFSDEPPECSIERIIREHHDTTPDDRFLNILKAADGKDAAIDRNNPLFTAEQEGGIIYDTDVFGAEGEKQQLKITCYDKKRDELYSKIHSQLESYLKTPDKITFKNRDNLFNNIIKCFFDKALSDTTRPNNDTSLWEHSYAVASIFKASLLHQLIYGERLDDFSKVKFGILGIGWDGLGFISKGEKIRDILGKKRIIDELKDEIRRKVEFDYLLGNSIYEDDNGIYFLIPSIPEKIDLETTNFDTLSEYGKLLQKIRDEVITQVINSTCGDIYPHFHLIQETTFTTRIVECIRKVKNRVQFPVTTPDDKYISALTKYWQNNTKMTVCPICQRRPIINDDGKICEVCKERRAKIPEEDKDNQQTPFIQEIVLASPESKKAALIVAKFGLERWLNGEMIRSLFVTEAKGLEKEINDLGNTKQFESEEQEVRQNLSFNYSEDLLRKGYDYARIKEEIDLCYNFNELTEEKKKQYARDIFFLYDRRIIKSKMNRNPSEIKKQWDSFIETSIEEYGREAEGLLYNLICAKTPTPSTVLDVWNTTRKFFEELPQEFRIDKQHRSKLSVEKPDEVEIGIVYEGTIVGEKVEVIWKEENQAMVIGKERQPAWKGKKIILEGKPLPPGKRVLPNEITEVAEDEYFPFRVITTTPDLFLVIVPADKALEISQAIYREYIEQFGKVIGRLPFSIGNIFFKEKTPMFVVLDAGRRMLKNFEKLHNIPVEARVSKDQQKNDITQKNISIKIDQLNIGSSQIERTIDWELPYKLGSKDQLGNSEVDYFHPYLMVKKGSKDYSSRKNYFQTIAKEVIHFTEVERGDILEIYPNYYDFEFLDATTRRYDILSEEKTCLRKSNLDEFFTKPYFLDELEQRFSSMWEKIRALPGITDTKLRNIESLWLTKLKDWEVDWSRKDSSNFQEWRQLIESTLTKEFAPEVYELLKESIYSGLFFDCLELNLRILKRRITKNGKSK